MFNYLEEGQPRSNLKWRIDFDYGSSKEGVSNEQGFIIVSIPPGHIEGRLKLESDFGVEIRNLTFGELDPVTENIGVRQRLCNLGFKCPLTGDEKGEDYLIALKEFQALHGVKANGEINDETRNKLVEIHGS